MVELVCSKVVVSNTQTMRLRLQIYVTSSYAQQKRPVVCGSWGFTFARKVCTRPLWWIGTIRGAALATQPWRQTKQRWFAHRTDDEVWDKQVAQTSLRMPFSNKAEDCKACKPARKLTKQQRER